MKTLIIKDLAIAADLDTKAMSGVRGGFAWKMPSSLQSYSLPSLPGYGSVTTNTTVTLDQVNNQYQSNATGNGSAAMGGSIYAYNNQQGFNSIGPATPALA